jgi:hypothetical protein
MKRAQSLGPGGLVLGPQQQQQQDAPVNAERAEQRQEQALRAPLAPDPTLKFWEDTIEAEIGQLGLERDPDLVARLKRALAGSNRAAQFQYTARLLFATQFHALLLLSQAADGLTHDDLRPVFEEHKQRIGAGSSVPDFLHWIGFLTHTQLAKLDGGRLKITDAGRQFLHWADTQNIAAVLRF